MKIQRIEYPHVFRTTHRLTGVRTLTGYDCQGKVVGVIPYTGHYPKRWKGRASPAEHKIFDEALATDRK